MSKCYIVVLTGQREYADIMADVERASAKIRELGMEPVHEIREVRPPEMKRREAIPRYIDKLNILADCDAVYFCTGWQISRWGKLLEHTANVFKRKCFYEERHKACSRKSSVSHSE